MRHKLILTLFSLLVVVIANSQNVGIGTIAPKASFNVAAGQTVLFGTDTTSAENKLMWLPVKGAFRVGYYPNSTNDPIGLYSTAMGTGVASGDYSTAIGSSYATGNYSTAMGAGSQANGYASTAIGGNNIASGDYSTAMGNLTIAKSVNETVIGTFNDHNNTNRLFEIGNGTGFTSLHNAVTVLNNGMVGIGTANPNALLNVAAGQTVLFGNDLTSAGNKLMWLPVKGAFRAGNYTGSTNDTIGIYSTVMGDGNAPGYASTAMGSSNASGQYSTAMGNSSASGYASTAMGAGCSAKGYVSTAIGLSTIASGDNSTAIGYGVSTNAKTGSFVIGDSDPLGGGTTNVGVADQFVARFHGGYYLETTSNATRTGVYMNSGANSWSSISDSTKKEKIIAVNGEDFLHKIAQFKLSTWNYKGQDSKTFRHYGPMAQDFYSAFGKDALGTIGCDTLINQQDFLGVSFIAIQALEKRTEKIEALQKQNIALQQQVDKQQQDNLAQQQQIDEQQQNNLALQQQMQTLLSTVASLNKQVQMLATKTNNQNTVAANK